MHNSCKNWGKRIKHKNIKNFLGKPIISWVISSAKKSKCFSEVFVSNRFNKNKKNF